MKCECIEFVNKQLEPLGQRLDTAFLLNPETLALEGQRVQISTMNSNGSKRKRPKPITGAFCPFCGKKVAQ